MEADIILVDEPMARKRLSEIATQRFGDLVKAVVDVDNGILALGAELHADEEAFLLDRGSRQEDLWGINIFPELPCEQMVEFDSMINVRPSQNNRSRSVEDPALRTRIAEIVSRLVTG